MPMYKETAEGTALLYLSLAKLDNLYKMEFSASYPPPRPKPPADTTHLLDLEEGPSEPVGVTVPDLDL